MNTPHSSVVEHVGCFYFLAIVNNAAININVQPFFAYLFSILSDIYVGVEFLGHMIIIKK